MIFDNLSSEVIKVGLISKLQFSLGFKLLGAVLQSKKPLKLDFETKALDYTPIEKAKAARRNWAEFQEWAQTHSYPVSTLEEIAQAYIKGTVAPVQPASPEIVALRAKISGKNAEGLKQQAEHHQEVAQKTLAEKVQALMAELHDITIYTNGFYHTGEHTDDDTFIEISDIILDTWVAENYPKVVKSQVAFWSKYNNWDDAELICIEADQQILEASKV